MNQGRVKRLCIQRVGAIKNKNLKSGTRKWPLVLRDFSQLPQHPVGGAACCLQAGLEQRAVFQRQSGRVSQMFVWTAAVRKQSRSVRPQVQTLGKL